MVKLCIGNWKMNCERKTFQKLDILTAGELKGVEIGIAVPYVYISTAKEVFGDKIHVCAQDCSRFEGGAYTGEVSAHMLEESGVKYVIIGHSERRIFMGESNKELEEKLARCIELSLGMVFCVGETLDQRENKDTMKVISEQLSILSKVKSVKKINIAYEPVWAIGTGKSAGIEDIEPVFSHIKDTLNFFGIEPRILYGGSVKSSNCAELSKIRNLGGFLVGNSSLSNELFWIAKSLEG